MTRIAGSQRLLITVKENANKQDIEKIDGVYDIVIRKRTYATEIDLHTTHPDDAENKISSLFTVLECIPLEEGPPDRSQEFYGRVIAREKEIMREAGKLFSEERYWEAHTVLEDLWRASKGEKRTYLQGLILIAAAMVHYQRDEPDIADRIYRRAINLVKSTGYWKMLSGNINEDFRYPVEFPVGEDVI